MNPVLASPALAYDPSHHALRDLDRLWGTPRPGAIVRAVLAAPSAAPERLLEVSDRRYGFVWDPPAGPSAAGTGAVMTLRVDGASSEARSEQLRRQSERVWGRLETIPSPGVPMLEPRFYGGLAFDAGAADQAPWSELGDGCFTLPRFLYVSDDGGAGLAVCATAEELADDGFRAALAAEVGRILAGLAEAPTETFAPWPASALPDAAGDADWIRRVEAIRGVIAEGEFEKIVAARRSEVKLERPLGAAEVLRRLSRGLRASTRFAFRRAYTSFLGATPERLITLTGLRFETEALAGSIESGGEHAAELLGSGKDRHEQQLVVDAIVRRFEPLCQDLQVAARPTVRELRDVLHLHTPIRGTLSRPRHVLELVEELHPTPAVGGVPTADAMRWIADHETHGRGWYAAPIGWFDAAGNGEFAVALRSCVLDGDRAWLFAGAGIVADSDPELELQETRLKQHSLLAALRG
ncbi:MAG: isochorismate synthase [Acidobacteriota bacterium]